MLPKIIGTGHSFKGACIYLLHDPDHAETSDRVAWTETRNLATSDPHVAWRVMAASAMSQAEIKAAGGASKVGRKPKGPVYHFTISWKEGEVEGLTREEMVRSADYVLGLLGRDATDSAPAQYANEHQAIMICHTDTKHPHVHVIVNRVHPEHGRMLVDSHSKKQLSRWAQEYEENNGKILCKNRVKNNAARDRGEFVRADKDKPRDQYEMEKKLGNRSKADRIRKEQRQHDRKLARWTEQVRQRQHESWNNLKVGYLNRKQAFQDQAKRLIAKIPAVIHKDFESRWRQLYSKHRRELVNFAKREQKFMGRIQNALAAVDWKFLLKGNDRAVAIKEVFDRIGSADKRLEAIKKSQQREARKLKSEERQAEKDAISKIRKQATQQLTRHRIQFLNRREELAMRRESEAAQIKQLWRDRRKDRRKAWEKQVASRDYNLAARNPDPRKTSSSSHAIDRNPDPRQRNQTENDNNRTR